MKESQALTRHANNEVLELPAAAWDDNAVPAGYGMEPANEGASLRDFARTLRKHLWLIISLVVVTTTLTLIMVAQKPDYYRAEARVQVNLESNPATGNAKGGAVIVNNPVNDPAYFTTQLQILEGPGLLRRVVTTLDLEHNQAFLNPLAGRSQGVWQNVLRIIGWQPKPNPDNRLLPDTTDNKLRPPTLTARQSAVEADAEAERLAAYVGILKSGLVVAPVKDNRTANKETRLIEIEYIHYDPQVAAKIVNTTADLYVLSNLERKVESNATAGDFLQKRVAELQTQIRSGEERLINYAKSHQILSLDQNQNTVVQRLADLNSKMGEAEHARIDAEAAYRAARDNQTAAAQAQAGAANPLSGQLASRLAELRQQLTKMQVEYTDDWPEVIETKRQITLLERESETARNQATTTHQSVLAATYQQALAREQELRRIFNQQRGEVLSQNEAAINYRILQQEIDTNKTLLDSLLQRSRENDVVLNGTPNNIVVVDRALLPRRPIGPQRQQTVLMAFALSLLASVGLAFLLEYLNDRVRETDNLEHKFGLPLLALIPSSVRRLRSFSLRRWRQRGPAVNSLTMSRKEHNAGGIEAYLQLRTYVLLSAPGGPPQTMLITSGQPGEGKTTVALNFAQTLVQAGEKVLLLDADLRCPRLHSLFEFDNHTGLTSLLAGKQLAEDKVWQAIQEDSSGVHLLTAGPHAPSPATLLGSAQMRQLLSLLEQRYTHIVIDSPPVLYFTDAVLLSSLVDGTIVLIRNNFSLKADISRTRKMLQDVGANVLGFVLNDVRAPVRDYYYYYERDADNHAPTPVRDDISLF